MRAPGYILQGTCWVLLLLEMAEQVDQTSISAEQLGRWNEI